MTTFHLRPVTELSPSPSPSASTSAPADVDHGPYKSRSAIRGSPSSIRSSSMSRRPLSPSFLRDVDLTNTSDIHSRKYPAPPTGHDLMAMFPPPPPDNFPELRPGPTREPTSGYFQRQERAFFAQAGKEILRVRVEVDLPHGSGASRSWPPTSASAHAPTGGSASASHSPRISTAPGLYPHSSGRPSPRSGLTSGSVPLFPLSTNHPHPHSLPTTPSNLHPTVSLHGSSPPESRSSPPDSSMSGKGDFSPEDLDDEAWRRPMPYAERRRAGKHTKRVIVRS